MGVQILSLPPLDDVPTSHATHERVTEFHRSPAMQAMAVQAST